MLNDVTTTYDDDGDYGGGDYGRGGLIFDQNDKDKRRRGTWDRTLTIS